MRRVLAILACSAGIAACSGGSLPTYEAPKPATLALPLRVESEPQGAEARSSTGQTCRTPCTLNVAASSDFSVSFALNGYLPQTVPVRLLPPLDPRSESETESSWQTNPNSVFAELQIAPPPKMAAPPKKVTKKKPTVSDTAPPPQRAAAPTAGPSGLPPPSPWPTR
ncbi:MAG: hypothetical protein HY659_15005 [Rhizobiales bacterium]|nr:hypothetical protein [Hyphomicrobiales bacterium]